MTRLWVLSDLHLEAVPFPDGYDPIRPEFDVLVAAGGRKVCAVSQEPGCSPLICTAFWNASGL